MTEKDVIDAIKKMRPTVYNYNHPALDDGKEHFGFIAQELSDIFPMDKYGLVQEKPDGLAVNYYEIIPMLVKYIHHLEERVSELENKIVR